MNYNDYKKIMKEKGLIETPESLVAVENAKVMQSNIKSVKKWNDHTKGMMQAFGVDLEMLMKSYSDEKEKYIRLALRTAVPEKEMIENAGNVYYSQIEILKRSTRPTRASCTIQL